MERHKKIGTLMIAVSIIMALTSVVFSENACHAGWGADESFLRLLLVCLRINFYEEIPGNEFSDHIYLPTKYALLGCAALLLLGGLFLKGVFASSHVTPADPKQPE
ncbi:hypothetical protein Tamer19_41910 [Cupriavidus sp. TA19]|uniref:hypothetical protein n=1 Tax=unclassified Cupriavidus TaxID=2640874 RepID=UPI000EE19DDD|nr:MULTISPECIES: hypothetical protein [unclassified Cupriavidus]BDB30736.1 hypothetical protein CTP10_R81530 [Cupriavidus sp. P-10]GLC94783.1 hypothetical protein Tamer19_41910 [Cupriavidus sp. TA19]